jgi:hypothetical protein
MTRAQKRLVRALLRLARTLPRRYRALCGPCPKKTTGSGEQRYGDPACCLSQRPKAA